LTRRPRSFRLRVGGLTLHVRSARPTPALRPLPYHRAFLARAGADMELRYEEGPTDAPRGRAEFESGGVWRVHRAPGRRLLYVFESRAARPARYKTVAVDARLRRGVLRFSPGSGPRNALEFPLDELLFQHRLSLDGGMEVHACGMLDRGRVALFPGRSGAGKSTMARLWRAHANGAVALSDDRVVVRRARGALRAWGTPWHGEGRFASPRAGRLAAVFFLRRGARSRAVPLAPALAAAELFARAFPPPWHRRAVDRVLARCADVARSVPCYLLRVRPGGDAVALARALLHEAP
jgi:hypothetical protein